MDRISRPPPAPPSFSNAPAPSMPGATPTVNCVPLALRARLRAASLGDAVKEEVERYAVSADRGIGKDAVAETWLRTFLSLPDNRAPIRPIPYDVALQSLDDTISGQTNAKRVLAAKMNWCIATGQQRFKVALVGPPGVGKTSLVRALGAIYGRPVVTIRVDQLAEASSLTGLAPSYQAVVTGALLDAFTRHQCRNPIIFLDELDKISPEKGESIKNVLNAILDDTISSFHSHYLNLPIDLSDVAFVSAANSYEALQKQPWLMERVGVVVPMRGYTDTEKLQLLDSVLLPRLNKELTSARGFSTNVSLIAKAADCIIADAAESPAPIPPVPQAPLGLSENGRSKLLELHLRHSGNNSGVRTLETWVRFLAEMALADRRDSPLDANFVASTISLLADLQGSAASHG